MGIAASTLDPQGLGNTLGGMGMSEDDQLGLASGLGGVLDPGGFFTNPFEEGIKKKKAAEAQAQKDAARSGALGDTLLQFRQQLEPHLKAQATGLQASQAGQRSQLAAQLQRMGVRGASSARQLRSFESNAAAQQAQNEFANRFKLNQAIEQVRAQRTGEFMQQDQLAAARAANQPKRGENLSKALPILGSFLGG